MASQEGPCTGKSSWPFQLLQQKGLCSAHLSSSFLYHSSVAFFNNQEKLQTSSRRPEESSNLKMLFASFLCLVFLASQKLYDFVCFERNF